MLLKSEIDSGVVGRSTYFMHHYHVDDQNTHWHDDEEQSNVYAIENGSSFIRQNPNQSVYDG